MAIVATDIGGTFTDVVGLDDAGRLTFGKVLSTPADYADGLVEGVSQMTASAGWTPHAIAKLLHGCTVATNVVLEKKGAKTVLVTTAGFRDVLELRRIRVPRLYQPLYRRPEPLVPRNLRLEVTERIAADGSVVTPLEDAALDQLVKQIAGLGPQALAVCLLNAHANPSHERRIGTRLRQAFPDVFLSLSCEVLPEMREYERTSTTVVNAYVGPAVWSYLTTLEARLRSCDITAPVVLMQSSGGMIESRRVRHLPAALLECGPAAGVIGAAKVGLASGYADLVTFDMGGTTAKAALVKGGAVSFTDVFEVGADISRGSVLAGSGGYAVKLPAVDMAEVGAGGGSLVSIDAGGAIRVGPESAGANPGPACYGFGNDWPTVTDANLVLGYLDPERIADGRVYLDRSLALEAVRRHVAEPLGLAVEEAALGIRRVANASMVRALKTVSVYRGHDTRHFRMFAFGGNGGLHGPEIASELGIREVIVPPAAGVFSAVGLLAADLQTTRTMTRTGKLTDFRAEHAAAVFTELELLVAQDLAAEVAALEFSEQVLCRYRGQAFELPVSMPAGWRTSISTQADLEQVFAAAHRQRYGYCPPSGTAIEIISYRVTGRERTSAGDRVKLASPGTQGSQANESRSGRRLCYFGKEIGTLPTVFATTRAILRDRLQSGPLLLCESDGTTLVPPGAGARLDEWDNIIITLQGSHMHAAHV